MSTTEQLAQALRGLLNLFEQHERIARATSPVGDFARSALAQHEAQQAHANPAEKCEGSLCMQMGKCSYSPCQSTKQQAQAADWTQPTTHVQRIADVVQLLCSGARPADEIVDAWLTDADDTSLQEFAIEHGPAWAQGIALIDAARVLADQPTEGVEHEHRGQAQAAEPVAWLLRIGNETLLTDELPTEFRPDDEEPDRWFCADRTPLYTAPPVREPLTDEEIERLWGAAVEANEEARRVVLHIARAIERAHGIGGKA